MRSLLVVALCVLLVGANVDAKKHKRSKEVPEIVQDTDVPTTSDKGAFDEGKVEHHATIVKHLPGDEPAAWHYKGEHGPTVWGWEDTRNHMCKDGAKQSPINLNSVEAGLNKHLGGFDFEDYAALDPQAVHVEAERYEESPERGALINTGHYFLLHWGLGSDVKIRDTDFNLDSVAFHSPSEHTVDGQHFDMEMQIMHTAEAGEKMVISVLFHAQHNAESEFLKKLHFDNLPQKEGDSEVVSPVDLLASLPDDKSYYTYQGSLTHPPCTEGVEWYVLQHPLFMSLEQLEAVHKVFNGNNRPVQPLGDRPLTINKSLFIGKHTITSVEPEGDSTEVVLHPDGSSVVTRVDVGSDDENKCDGCHYAKNEEWREKLEEQAAKKRASSDKARFRAKIHKKVQQKRKL